MIKRIFRFIRFSIKNISKTWKLTKYKSVLVTFMGFNSKEEKEFIKRKHTLAFKSLMKKFSYPNITMEDKK